MTKLDLKHAKTKTYAVRGYNVDITFVYDERNIYIVQNDIICQLPDHDVAKNKFKHIRTDDSVTIKKGDVRENKYLAAVFSGERQNQARVNTTDDTIIVLKRFNLPLADKMIETINQRKSSIKKLQTRLTVSRLKPSSAVAPNQQSSVKKEIKPMIVDATKVKKLAKGKTKKHDCQALERKYNNIKQAFETKLKEYEKLSAKHNSLRERYSQVDNENARLFKKLGQAEIEIEGYENLKNDYKRTYDANIDLRDELHRVKHASFGKRLAVAFTGKWA